MTGHDEIPTFEQVREGARAARAALDRERAGEPELLDPDRPDSRSTTGVEDEVSRREDGGES